MLLPVAVAAPRLAPDEPIVAATLRDQPLEVEDCPQAAHGAKQPFTSNAATDTSTWVSFSLPFIATGSSTTITLTGANGANYIGLDNVTVEGRTVVSSPGTLGLLGLGLLGLSLTSRRAN